jgi:hypothetical protein
MPDDVRPISEKNPGPGSLYSFNGIGFGLKGLTRTDRDGFCLATRWFMIAGLPIIPLGRYYIREEGTTVDGISDTATRYTVAGTASLRVSEVLRTYAFSWLTPIAVIVPMIAVLHRADEVGFWWCLAMVTLWPITGIALAVTALYLYRDRWAPLREVRWRDR